MQISALSKQLAEQWLGESDQIVKSAGRALRIFEVFDVLQREAHVSEVSELLSIPQSSASVLLRSMVSMGYLSFNNETRAYAPTLKIAMLGSWVKPSIAGTDSLLELVHRISERLNRSVVLAVRNRIWSQYAHVVLQGESDGLFVAKGACRSLVASSTGLALLSAMPDPEIRRIAMRINSEADCPEKVVKIPDLLERIKEVRERGYVIACNLVRPGRGMLVLPLSGLKEHLVLGVGASSETLDLEKDHMLEVIRQELDGYIISGEATSSDEALPY